jgi:hypothetical protein
MLCYLDNRYKDIFSHQGLSRFVQDFPKFHKAIEEYVQPDHLHELDDGTMTIVPGINFLPWDVFAFINDSIDCISTPFSGLRGEYEGAARTISRGMASKSKPCSYLTLLALCLALCLLGKLMLASPPCQI